MRSHLLIVALALVFGGACSNTRDAALPAASQPAAAPSMLGAWYWLGSNSAESTQPSSDPQRYRIEFSDDKSLLVQADCNTGGGSYSRPQPSEFIPGPIGLSKRACAEDSQDRLFIAHLNAARRIGADSQWLQLDSADGNATMHFGRDPQSRLQGFTCDQGAPVWLAFSGDHALLLADGKSFRLSADEAQSGKYSAGSVELHRNSEQVTLKGMGARSLCKAG